MGYFCFSDKGQTVSLMSLQGISRRLELLVSQDGLKQWTFEEQSMDSPILLFANLSLGLLLCFMFQIDKAVQ
jgi:hypothetical protein